jgi:hypothetical protein
MRRFAAAVVTVATVLVPIASRAQQAERVPEGIHSEGDGKPDVCGLQAQSIAALEMQVRSRSDVEILDQTADYSAYAIGDYRQLTFTTKSNRAHPAVACRQAVAARDGGSTVRTSIACFNSRENCDWLYREFEALTKRMLDAMNGGR